ncbi:MAG: M1 family metallopeptidase [Cyclobacteriaceae bacterium]|nr:M1 family metallopeptidase [Cyclobacteriaceae bacterium]
MKSLLIVLLYFPVLGFSQQQQNLSIDDFDIKHYTFALELNDSTDSISGKATVSVLFKKARTDFSLDLSSQNKEGKGMHVSQVSLNGKSLSFEHIHDRLTIALNTPAAPNEKLSFEIYYKGIPQDGLIIEKNKYNDRTFFGENWPNNAHHWLPTIDHPSDKAGVDFIVIAPPYYEVIGNGVKLEESMLNAHQKLTHWHEVVDIPTKVMVIGVARFAVQHAGYVNTIAVESWVYPQNRLEGFSDYAIATKVLDFFNSHFGPYAYKKLANVQSKTRYGGTENASNIFYYENSVTGKGGIESLVAHEVAHQWFGNSASEKDWHHVWLSEGFATYCTHLYNEFTYGRDRRAGDMEADREDVLKFFKKSPQPIVFKDLPKNLVHILNDNSYQKGGWVLHMLRQELGDQPFWAGLREYYRRYQNSNASTGDFQTVMEEVSGKDLDQFFQQWLYRAGHPVIEGFWSYDSKTKTVNISITQNQKNQLFDFPLELGFEIPNQVLSRVEEVRINKESQKFSFTVDTKPTRIALDPNTNLLFEGKMKN